MNRLIIFRRLCSTTAKYKRKRVADTNFSPIALQFIYGDATKVQQDPLHKLQQIDVEGVQKTEQSTETPVYPFAIYDSLQLAKDDGPKGRILKRRFRRPRHEVEEADEAPHVDDVKAHDTVKSVNDDEVFRHGTSDPKIPISRIPCSGCGARLHCQDSKLPGFLPFEVFYKIRKNDAKLRKSQCQRCVMIRDYNVALKMNIKPEDYSRVISQTLKHVDKAIVVLIVDLTDFPGSVWPNILDLIGHEKRILLVGNKVDLLPQDSRNHLDTIKESMVKTFLKKCQSSLNKKPIILDSILISARTGFNVEYLISKIFKHWRENSKYLGGNVYLVGTTNVGKSSLFNQLLDSDMCDAKALNRIEKATIAQVPGTTLNLLKFPIMRPDSCRISLRHNRLMADKEAMQQVEQERIKNLRSLKSVQYSVPHHPVGQTFVHLADKQFPTSSDSAFEMNLRGQKKSLRLDFHPEEYRENKWCMDTPGTISEDQVINLFTQEEIMRVMPTLPMLPRSVSLKLGHSLVIGGVARLDLLKGPSHPNWESHPLVLTIFTSDVLPIAVIETPEVEDFIKEAFEKDELKVPSKSNKDFPPLEGQELTVYGVSDIQSGCDIVLSSIGWISVTTRVTLTYLVKAWTPAGKGIYLRELPFLPYAVNLKGPRPRGSPYFGQSKLFLP